MPPEILIDGKVRADLEKLRNEFGFEWHALTPYHIRIENVLDIYPVRQKWHDIRSNLRGRYDNLVQFVADSLGATTCCTCPKCGHSFFTEL